MMGGDGQQRVSLLIACLQKEAPGCPETRRQAVSEEEFQHLPFRSAHEDGLTDCNQFTLALGP
jgi:hypothetical protein